MKKVAIIGSSGGNLFHSGGGDPARLLGEIAEQCRSADIAVEAALFIAASGSMDYRGAASARAELYEWDGGSRAFRRAMEGSLGEANRQAAIADAEIAGRIEEGRIDGLILMSCDPLGVNRASVEAAVRRKLPIVGTGGTSMGRIKAMGANVVSLSGTTGTTNLTRAVSFVIALSRHWKLPYRMAGTKTLGQARISGVLSSAMPAFIAVLLLMSAARLPALSGLEEAAAALSALPGVVLAIFAARRLSDLGEATLIAGAVCGLLCVSAGIIGAALGGLAAGWLVPRLFQLFVRSGFPATTVNIAAGALSGLAPGLLLFFAAGTYTSAAGDAVRHALEWTVGLSPVAVGAVFGLAMWPLILKGWYHVAVLPLILIEMERYGNSLIGALDMAGLVMVSAGILLAQLAVPPNPGERRVVLKPLWLNVGFGTFIEASYVYMRKSRAVYAGAVVASGLAGAVVGGLHLRSTAYVPSYLAVLFSNDAAGFLVAMLTGLLAAFIVGICVNWASRRTAPESGPSNRKGDM
ncbi:hypothetical protein [Cohnella massiliensis]|uniref:hypothetical protein n=1 Tax=Cohnella massiliensis TaxID=1816691 RepID=UPI0009BA8D52|nr:hypothetical protein [Cohnella massiliensis]